MGDKAQRPFAHMSFAELHVSRRGGKRLSLGQQYNGTGPFGEGNGSLLFPEPSLQRGTRCIIKGDVER